MESRARSDSVVAVTNDTGSGLAPTNPWRFAGEYFDTETALFKIGERYYDPALARWTQKDPDDAGLLATGGERVQLHRRRSDQPDGSSGLFSIGVDVEVEAIQNGPPVGVPPV